MIKKITSATNPLIQQAIKLHNAKYRASLQKFIAEGERTIATLAQTNTILTLCTTEIMLETALQYAPEDSIMQIPAKLMEKISTSKTPSGLLAIFAIPVQKSLNTLNTGIVITRLQDPGNVGTLIRTAAAMNKKTVVLIESVDPWSPKVVQASAGTIGLVDIFCISWETLRKNKNHTLCALTVSEGQQPSAALLKNALIVIGSEAHGIPQEWLNQCETKVTLNMPGQCESLNAAVAGSIALYLAAQ